MRTPRQVALMFPMGQLHHARLLRGITDYAQQHGGWTLQVNTETVTMSIRSLRGWPGHGVIAPLNTRSEVKAAKELGVPVVNHSGVIQDTGLSRVMVDHTAVGRMAATHLLERGFQRYAYSGLRGVWYSRLRYEGFAEEITKAGKECVLWESPASFSAQQSWYRWMAPLEQWLRTLQPPIGLMAVHDHRAAQVVEACQRLGLGVPKDVAVIGTDNNEVICEFSPVPLSSVSVSARRVGYEAAALLDRLMSRNPTPIQEMVIPPDGVVERRSTDIIAVEDAHVAAVVHYIHEHIGEAFRVEDLETLVPVSRRWLERRFRTCFNCTPHEYICRIRIERAKQLLLDPRKLRMHKIAASCGFYDPKRFRLVFQRIAGMKPAEYRRLNMIHPESSSDGFFDWLSQNAPDIRKKGP